MPNVRSLLTAPNILLFFVLCVVSVVGYVNLTSNHNVTTSETLYPVPGEGLLNKSQADTWYKEHPNSAQGQNGPVAVANMPTQITRTSESWEVPIDLISRRSLLEWNTSHGVQRYLWTDNRRFSLAGDDSQIKGKMAFEDFHDDIVSMTAGIKNPKIIGNQSVEQYMLPRLQNFAGKGMIVWQEVVGPNETPKEFIFDAPGVNYPGRELYLIRDSTQKAPDEDDGLSFDQIDHPPVGGVPSVEQTVSGNNQVAVSDNTALSQLVTPAAKKVANEPVASNNTESSMSQLVTTANEKTVNAPVVSQKENSAEDALSKLIT